MEPQKKSRKPPLKELLALRKQAETTEIPEGSLREREQQARSILDHTFQFIGLMLPDGTLVEANRAALAFAGIEEADVLGKPFWETPWWAHSPEMQDQLKAAIRAALQGQLVRFEAHHPASDGTLHYIDFSLKPVTDEKGRVIFLVPEGRDITDRKAAEEVLSQSRAELQAIYDGMVDGVLIADGETMQFLRANSAICRLLQYHEAELLSLSVNDIHPPEAVAAVREKFYALQEGRLKIYENCPFLRKDGSLFYADITANQITYHGRRCLIGFFRDTTERKQAQEALERERRALQHMLHASDHERQLIAYDIHDGLAQQIAGALMQFEVFDRYQESKPKQAAEAFQAGLTMLRQSHFEARRLINGVRPPVLDESGVVAAIAHLVHEPRGPKSPEIEFQSKVQFGRLESVEENAIYRIVQEGVTNACSHSKSKKVRVRLVQRGAQVRIEIRDWGRGFHPEALPQKQFGLTGIRERARLLGGKCRIESRPGKGTTIAVELPIVERKAEE
jgi:PAS domain S-box-containing protein